MIKREGEDWMLETLSRNYMKQIDDYISKNFDTITCGELRSCYTAFVDESLELTGIFQNYKSLPEYLVHRFMYYLCQKELAKGTYEIESNKRYQNVYRDGENEVDISIVHLHQMGNTEEERKMFCGISVKAAKMVNIKKDYDRAHNVMWGKHQNMKHVLITFHNEFNVKKVENYCSERYHIINLEKEPNVIFIEKLKEILCLSQFQK